MSATSFRPERFLRPIATTALMLVLCAGCPGQPPRDPAAVTSPASTAEPTTDDEKAIYAMGIGLARQLAPLHLTEAELAILAKGLSDGALGRSASFDPEPYRGKIEELANRRSQAAAAGERATGAEFLKTAAAEPGAKTLPSGVVMTVLKPGAGESPLLSQSVQVRYKGSLPNGTVFDSSEREPEPAVLAMGRVIPCWAQALQLMKEGEKARLICPPDLAYGDRGFAPSIPPGATLLFEVELVKVIH